MLEALAAHATVALSKAHAIERLKEVAEDGRLEAMHDPLTALPNRRAFSEAMQEAIARGEGGAVLLLDLDDFKDVNDTLGHTAGDALLRVTGMRLENETDGIVGRLGGDEFAVLLPGVSVSSATALAHRLRSAITQPVMMNDVELITAASIGVAEMADSAGTSDDVLARADVAMYAAKEAGTGVESYRAEDGDAIGRRLVLAADLARALEKGELELWFQPQALLVNNSISGFEALLRWAHPQFGWVPPPEIVAVAQRTGLARSLTDFILEQSLRNRARWAKAGFDIEVAVNVTPRDIADASLVSGSSTSSRRLGPLPPRWSSRSPRATPSVIRSAAWGSWRSVRCGSAALGGRLRHRLLEPGLPRAATGRRGQDRPVVRVPARAQPGGLHHRPRHRGTGT